MSPEIVAKPIASAPSYKNECYTDGTKNTGITSHGSAVSYHSSPEKVGWFKSIGQRAVSIKGKCSQFKNSVVSKVSNVKSGIVSVPSTISDFYKSLRNRIVVGVECVVITSKETAKSIGIGAVSGTVIGVVAVLICPPLVLVLPHFVIFTAGCGAAEGFRVGVNECKNITVQTLSKQYEKGDMPDLPPPYEEFSDS